MARIRTIKPEFWQNEQLASVSEHARLLAIALLNHSDDKGYFLANPALVRSSCFPFEDSSEKVLGSLQELSGIDYIDVRDCGGKAIGFVCKFLEHQRIDKPQKSKLEPIFEESGDEGHEKHERNGHSDSVPVAFLERSRNGQRLEQGTGKGKEQVLCSEADEPPAEPPFDPSGCSFPEFPCSGNPKTWTATEKQLSDWQATYPAVSIAAEHRKAHAWVMANLSRRKTAGGYPRFLNAWFGKQQDKGGTDLPRSTAPTSKPLQPLRPRVAQ